MPNLSALSANQTKAIALSNLILISPTTVVGYQPQNPPNADGTQSTKAQPPAFLFDYEGEQVLTLESDITDHYVENNTAIQDQIALRPEMFVTHGFVGELNDVTPFALKPLKFAADRLTSITAYEPQLSTTALLAYALAFQAYQTAANLINTAVSAWDSLLGNENQTKQQIAYQKFYGYWKDRTLFTIQTPWCVFQNMAIKSLRAIQDAETDKVTDFELTFKMIRTASTFITSGSDVSVSGRLGAQSSNLTDLGTSSPVQSTSLGSGLAQMGVA